MSEQAGTLHALGGAIVDAALKVHKELGPGLLESVYEHCLAHEPAKRNVPVRRQVPVPINYDGERLDAGFRIDLLVGEPVIIEIKAVDKMIPVYEAQLLTYLKLTGSRMGFLINFNVRLLRDGVKRYVL